MSQYSYKGIGADESGLDTGDFDLSEPLTVALTLHVVLTTAELDDAHFVVTTLRNDFGNHFSAVYDRSADLNVVAIADQQNAIESHGFASGDFELLDLEEFAFGDFVLLATSNNYCVHGKSPLILLTQRFRKVVIGWHGCSGPEVTPLQLRKAGKCPGGSSGCAIVRKRRTRRKGHRHLP
jgi:hypothetical protein